MPKIALHTCILGASKGETAIPALSQALLGSHETVDVLGIDEGAAVVAPVISVAAQGGEVLNVDLIKRYERRVGVNGDGLVGTAGLARVSAAGEFALRILQLTSVDRRAAVADTVVFETGIAEAVALAGRSACFDRHVVLVEGCTPHESIRAALVLEAARVDKRPEGIEAGR